MGVNVMELIQGYKEDHDPEKLLPIWKEVEPVARFRAAAFTNRRGMESYYDDVLQESFMVLPEAIEAYDTSRVTNVKSFRSWFSDYFMPKAFRRAYYGDTSAAAKHDPCIDAISGYSPVAADDPEGMTVFDTVEDPEAEEALQEMEDREYWEQVGEAINQIINELPERTRAVVDKVLKEGCSITDAHAAVCPELSYSTVNVMYREAIRKIRRSLLQCGMYRYLQLEDSIKKHRGDSRYYHSGAKKMLQNGLSSSVERIALRNTMDRERIEMLFGDIE